MEGNMMDSNTFFSFLGILFASANLMRLLNWIDQPHTHRAH